MSAVQRMTLIRAMTIALVLAASPRFASADDEPFTIGSRPVWFLLGGVTTGGTVALADRGAYVGGELSVARLRDGNHFGFYADGYYDWGADGTYVTAGMEAGRKWLGVDAGAAVRFAAGETQLGATGRVTLGLGVVGVYVRYAYFDAMTSEHVLQVGALLKLPFATFGGK